MSIARRTATILVGVLLVTGCGGDEESPLVDGELEASVSPVDDPTEDGTDEPSEDEPSDEDAGGTATEDDGDPAAACTVTEEESRIELVAPRPGDELPSTFRLAGCGNTFEATYLWELELDDGGVAGSGFGTMTCGSGCVGTFDEEISVDATGDGVLRVFEEDAADGERVNVVEVPVTIGG